MMPRKRIVPSSLPGRTVSRKPRYESESVAKAEAERLGMTYYRCDFCNRFHLASK